ncbi:MAG: efflux RND transporter periplasmic adaptor subunit [Deltaproteobacteria bacterium]|jgi:multidrug efflux system membrane fusion protein|nr:efflux RND transporter periplasmic adaptor subunit [Deltaproteobacteria bacterium]
MDKRVPPLWPVLCLCLALAACSGGEGDGRKSAAAPVLLMEVTLRDMPRLIRVVGNVAASATVGVKARVTGELVGVHFTEGQDVREGQPLFTIDPRPFQASLNEAQSRLERDIAQLNKAAEDMKRYGKLVSEGYVSREAYDKAVTDAAALRATVRADEAALESTRLQLSYCSITAPISGRAGAIRADRGNMIKANDDAPLLVLDALRPVYLNFAVPEARLSEILARQRENNLDILATPAGGESSSGKLTFVDNAVDIRTGTIRLRGTFANENRTLWPGQFVQVTLMLGTDRDVVVIPAKAVQSGRNENFVYVVDANGKAQVRPIVVDPEDDGRMIVREGLVRGERIVLEGQVRLAPGVPVEIRQQ